MNAISTSAALPVREEPALIKDRLEPFLCNPPRGGDTRSGILTAMQKWWSEDILNTRRPVLPG